MPGLIIQRTPLRMEHGTDRKDRRESAKFRVGDDVVITLLEVRGYQVRVHIEAPRHVAVHREEVYQRIRQAVGGGGAPAGPPGRTWSEKSPKANAVEGLSNAVEGLSD